MKRIIILNIFLIGILFSCNSGRNYKNEKQSKSKPKLTDITSYTGNAVAFFYEDDFRGITFIPVLEKDSNKFKKADIFKLIEGRCSINLSIGDYLTIKLLDSGEKKILNRKICNIYGATYFAKIWISYSGYEESLSKHKNDKMIDSCRCRDLGLIVEPNGGIHEFKILCNSK